MSGTYKLSDLQKKKVEELIDIYKQLTGDKFKDEDVKDKDVNALSELIVDREFEVKHATLFAKSPKELVKEIEKLRENEKNVRTKHKATEEELGKLKTAVQDTELAKMIDEGKVDEVVVKLREKITTLETTNKELKTKADSFDNIDKTRREAVKTKLGDKYLPYMDNAPIDELEQTAQLLMPNGSGDKEKKEEGKDTFNSNKDKTNPSTTALSPEDKIAQGLYTTPQ